MTIDFLMKGSNYPEYDTYTIKEPHKNVIMGITAGRSKDAKQKFNADTNEDSIAIAELPNNCRLYMIADAHDSPSSSEIAVSIFPEILSKNINPKNIMKSLYSAVLELDNQVRIKKPLVTSVLDEESLIKDMSSTTFIAALSNGIDFYYVSVGDSYIYELNKSEMNHVNFKQFLKSTCKGWIGINNRPLTDIIENYFSNSWDYKELSKEMYEQTWGNSNGLKSIEQKSEKGKNFLFEKQFKEKSISYDSFRHVIDIGKISLNQDSTIILATDGIDPMSSGIELEEFNKMIQDEKLKSGIDNYLQNVLQMEQAIYKSDNIGLIAIRK